MFSEYHQNYLWSLSQAITVISFNDALAASHRVRIVDILRRLVRLLDEALELFLKREELAAWILSDAGTAEELPLGPASFYGSKSSSREKLKWQMSSGP